MIVYQLGHVLIRSRDQGGKAGLGSLFGQGSNYVVRLYTSYAENREADGFNSLCERLKLRP